MSQFEMVISSVCVLGVVGAWWRMATLPAFSQWLEAWTLRHNKEAEKAIITAYADGHQDGQEYARLRGSKPRG